MLVQSEFDYESKFIPKNKLCDITIIYVMDLITEFLEASDPELCVTSYKSTAYLSKMKEIESVDSSSDDVENKLKPRMISWRVKLIKPRSIGVEPYSGFTNRKLRRVDTEYDNNTGAAYEVLEWGFDYNIGFQIIARSERERQILTNWFLTSMEFFRPLLSEEGLHNFYFMDGGYNADPNAGDSYLNTIECNYFMTTGYSRRIERETIKELLVNLKLDGEPDYDDLVDLWIEKYKKLLPST